MKGEPRSEHRSFDASGFCESKYAWSWEFSFKKAVVSFHTGWSKWREALSPPRPFDSSPN
jgi:hypothetical protein